MIGRVVLVLLVCLIPGTVYSQWRTNPDDPAAVNRGRALRHLLLSAISDASVIRVVEHSDRLDYKNPNDPNYKQVAYATVTLNPKQIEALRKALPTAPDYSGSVSLDCIFEEHHRIEITRKDGSVLALHLCFQCGELFLNDDRDDRIMPEGRQDSLSQFMVSLGLHPHGPWKKPDVPK